jgi:mannose-6-phosphate isomerase-like protein (cupin superfamily)
MRLGSSLLLILLPLSLHSAEEPRTVDPTFLRRHVPDLGERQADVTTATCHYKPIFGAGDPQARILRGITRFGEMTIDGGGACASVSYADEEQVYVVLDGAASLDYASTPHAIRKHDFLYLRPGSSHAVKNSNAAPCRIVVMGFRVSARTRINGDFNLALPIANMDDVPLQTVEGHPASTQYRLLMGGTESKRDRIAAGLTLTSLYLMEFAPGGTNFPHHHERAEEIYLVLDGTGDMVAGGGMDGIEGRHPTGPGDAWFFRLNCTVGFYSAPASKARILAVRSWYPGMRIEGGE